MSPPPRRGRSMRRHRLAAVPVVMLLAVFARAFADEKSTTDKFVPKAPLGIDQAALDKACEQEPLTHAKVELGRQLYFDGRLSKDGSVSCSSCHAPSHGWGDPGKFSKGVGGKLGGRHAPT